MSKKTFAKTLIILLVIFLIFLASPAVAAVDVNSPSTEKKTEFKKDANTFGKADEFSTGELFYKLITMVILVGVVGGGALYLSRKLLPNITKKTGKKIKIKETVYLGPKKCLHIVEAGNKKFLIGSTNENISNLADLTIALSDLDDIEMSNLGADNENK